MLSKIAECSKKKINALMMNERNVMEDTAPVHVKSFQRFYTWSRKIVLQEAALVNRIQEVGKFSKEKCVEVSKVTPSSFVVEVCVPLLLQTTSF